MQRSASEMMNHATMRTVSGMLRNFSATLPDTLLAGLPGSLLPPHTPRPISVPQTARAWQPGDQASFFKSGIAMYACQPYCSRFIHALPSFLLSEPDLQRVFAGLLQPR